MTPSERAWAMDQHKFLFEYVRTQDDAARAALTDKNLASEIISASWDYVRCTM